MNQSKSEIEAKFTKTEILARRNTMKQYINGFARMWIKTIPELEATTKISKLTNEIFIMMKGNIKYQKNPKVQKAFEDGNFAIDLEFLRKLLIFLIETDNHYEKQVGYFYIHAMLKTNRLYETWCDTRTTRDINFEEFVIWFLDIESDKIYNMNHQ